MKLLLPLIFLLFSCLGSAQHQDKVDFIRGEVFIRPLPKKKKIEGSVIYTFKVLHDVDSVFLDAKNMEFSSVLLDGKSIGYDNTGNEIVVRKKLKKSKVHGLELHYSAKPKQTVYFLNTNDSMAERSRSQIWTQGQGKYTSHWLPSFDDMEEKVEFDLSISTDLNHAVVANGKNMGIKIDDQGGAYTSFDMQKPMSSYLLAFVIGDYDKQVLKSKSGITIENYYYRQDSLKVEPTYRYTAEIFDFLENEIGVPYPWQNYKQVPVHDFLYAGMENTTLTIFSDQYVIDSTAFIDKNYVNVNAHEMAHQWFGNLVTEKDGNHHWLHEGFATYYAYLAQKEIFGEDHFYWKLYEILQQLKSQEERGEGQSLLDPKASSLTFYEKGALALFMLRNTIRNEAFREGIKMYLNKYQFKNVTVDDFLNEMEKASGHNLTEYRTIWLESENLPFEKAKEVLFERSSSLKLLLQIEADLKSAKSDDIDYHSYWHATNSIHLKKSIIENYGSVLSDDVYAEVLASDTLPIRQSLLAGNNLPDYLTKKKLEGLLKDDSYITKEWALFTLWQKYPENRPRYLNDTKNIVGLPNKNIRLMWLTLAILTDGYTSAKTKDYFDELSSYTNSEYSFEVRQSAFFYLKQAFGFDDLSLANLMKATEHHSWQFRKYARNLLNELLEDGEYQSRIKKLVEELNPEEIRYLLKRLELE